MKKRLLFILSHPARMCHYLISFLLYSWRFKDFHFSDIIKKPLSITPQSIRLGRGVFIGHNARIIGVKKYNGVLFSPDILFSDGVSIQQGLHLTCARSVTIGKNTAIAAYVTITDINHPYEDINLPIEKQNLEVKPVSIGDDCKVYNGAVILPGVTIGKHVVVGANSVVTSDLPDYCVAVGSPAKIVKQYNPISKTWERLSH